jgi:DNA replicative helicase MCM subunit Mcm2 (Cdc46/Mcm family)
MRVFRLLVHSLCPVIYDHEMVRRTNSWRANRRACACTCARCRRSRHGKKSHVQACAAPRGEKNKGSCTEAGALALVDHGICAIDEFEKIACENSALLKVMEQQRVSICKAGARTSVPAKTTIIAVGNPRDGHYNRGKSLPENLKLTPQLLSRFDLVFIMLDRPNSAQN